ncbi:MAG TPA: TOBE domain-containing protein, partial [Blastocatellia bacterium]|nr:TOBE domain-containing protein [Blastocatellia bacterium]
ATKLGIIRDLKELNRRLHLPIIYVTHSRDEAITLGAEVIIYERGRIIARGEPLEVFGSPVTMSVARLTGVENIFEGTVIKRSEQAATMTVEISDSTGNCRLEVPLSSQPTGARVKIAIRPGDILLATEEPRFTSARNILRGRITAVEHRSDRTVVRVNGGVAWSVNVTRQSINDLGLSPDSQVWLAIKTSSCHLLDQP